MNRRRFLLSSAGAATWTALPAIADTVTTRILLWIPGGMAATETFDPKAFVPFRHGLEARRVLTTAPSIATAQRGVSITQGLERIAALLDRATLVRAFTPDTALPLAHGPHQKQWLEWFSSWGTPTITNGNFEAGCRTALRAADEGVRSVVVPIGFLPFAEWDTHEHGAARMPALKAAIDAPVATLVEGLERRGLLRSTRVILASEFSRAPDVEGTARIAHSGQYGVHAHAAASSSVVIFGGASGGRVIGATADDGSGRVVRDPVDFARLRDLCG